MWAAPRGTVRQEAEEEEEEGEERWRGNEGGSSSIMDKKGKYTPGFHYIYCFFNVLFPVFWGCFFIYIVSFFIPFFWTLCRGKYALCNILFPRWFLDTQSRAKCFPLMPSFLFQFSV